MKLLLPFETDDPLFTLGFEAGRLWTLVQAGDLGPHTIHQANSEMTLRISEALGLAARSELDDAGVWMHVEFS